MNTLYVPPKNSGDPSAGINDVAPFHNLTAEQQHALRVAADREASPARRAARVARRAAESQT